MERQELERRVTGVVARVLGIDPGEISPTSNFIFDLGADSMASIEMMAGFDDEFGIEMDQDRAREVQTVEGAVEFIATYV